MFHTGSGLGPGLARCAPALSSSARSLRRTRLGRASAASSPAGQQGPGQDGQLARDRDGRDVPAAPRDLPTNTSGFDNDNKGGRRGKNDTYGSARAAHPGESQGRPGTPAGSQPIAAARPARPRSPRARVPERHEPTDPRPGRTDSDSPSAFSYRYTTSYDLTDAALTFARVRTMRLAAPQPRRLRVVDPGRLMLGLRDLRKRVEAATRRCARCRATQNRVARKEPTQQLSSTAFSGVRERGVQGSRQR